MSITSILSEWSGFSEAVCFNVLLTTGWVAAFVLCPFLNQEPDDPWPRSRRPADDAAADGRAAEVGHPLKAGPSEYLRGRASAIRPALRVRKP